MNKLPVLFLIYFAHQTLSYVSLRLVKLGFINRIKKFTRGPCIDSLQHQVIGTNAEEKLKQLTRHLLDKSSPSFTLRNIVDFGRRKFCKYSINDGIKNQSDILTVPDCSSIVHLSIENCSCGNLNLRGFADTLVGKGLVAIVLEAFNGTQADELLSKTSVEWVESMELEPALSAGRVLGLRSIFSTLQRRTRTLSYPTVAKSNVTSCLPSSLSRALDEKYEDCYENRILLPIDDNFPLEKSSAIAVLLSGGVDSSVALRLLQLGGYTNLTAFYIKIWLEDEIANLQECPWEEDLHFASLVCRQLNVPLEIVNLQDVYWEKVINYTLAEARRGKTPNPDIMCNRYIKFGAFIDYFGQRFDRIATGHYARLRANNSIVNLMCAVDNKKDQTYFLSMLDQQHLRKALFPVGYFTKVEVRELARKHQLPTVNRKDSQGICFLGKLKFPEFIKHYLGEKPGKIRRFGSGDEMGEHAGLWFHTIGQRKGLGMRLNPAFAAHGPWFVRHKDTKTNELWLCSGAELQTRPLRSFCVEDFRWIAQFSNLMQITNNIDLEVLVKLRHGPDFLRARLILPPVIDDGKSFVRVKLMNPDVNSVAPGQFAVFYIGKFCIAVGKVSVLEDDQ